MQSCDVWDRMLAKPLKTIPRQSRRVSGDRIDEFVSETNLENCTSSMIEFSFPQLVQLRSSTGPPKD